VSSWTNITTSRRQKQTREGMSRGAGAKRRPRAARRERPQGAVTPSAKVRADGQIRIAGSDSNRRNRARRVSHRDVASQPHRRLGPWASQHKMTKPNRCEG